MTLITIWPRYKTYYLLCLTVFVWVFLFIYFASFKFNLKADIYYHATMYIYLENYPFTLRAPLAGRLVIASRIINIYKMPIVKTKHKINKMLYNYFKLPCI